MAQLRLDGLSKDFGAGRAAVSDVTLTVREGGFLALVGPSGCGKTTVLRMIAGFEQPTSGSISFGDRLLSDNRTAVAPEKRNMAMVFQSYALWPHMSVADNVGYPLKVRGIAKQALKRQVAEALAVVQLQDYAGRRPAELSGGQRQRVALARCLVASPDIILLDEPLANLDRHLKGAMEETFRALHARSGATFVYVTHDQGEAMAMATDVAVMSQGRLLQVAAPQDLYARPEGPVVGGLVGQGAILTLALPRTEIRLFKWPHIKAAMEKETSEEKVEVLVRPEHVIADETGAPFTVTAQVFSGERFLLTLRSAQGHVLNAYSPAYMAAGTQAGFSVRQAWRL